MKTNTGKDFSPTLDSQQLVFHTKKALLTCLFLISQLTYRSILYESDNNAFCHKNATSEFILQRLKDYFLHITPESIDEAVWGCCSKNRRRMMLF